MITPIFQGIVEHGQLKLNNRDSFERYLTTLNGEVNLTVAKRRKPRSDNQNKWYWSCIVKIAADHFGYTSEEMHDVYRMMFLVKHEKGKPATLKSSTSLSTHEFYEFCERCRQFCAEQNLVIPDPNSYQN